MSSGRQDEFVLMLAPKFSQPAPRFRRMACCCRKEQAMETSFGSNEHESSQSMILGSHTRMSEFSDAAHEMGRKITDAASRAGDYIEEKAGVVGEKIKDLQGKNLNEIADEAKDYARRKPGQAILISAAAGLVLGFLLRSSRRVF
jgi:ElaB/YqjD/DUF883 family membrane-anchored ribosome-binding protein